MANVISVSRRTDVPAFYGEWFMKRVREGAAGYINPIGGQKLTLSLRPEDVLAFVFWSKNYKPFLKHLDELDGLGYKFYFHFTITGHPRVLETRTPEVQVAIDTAKYLADRYSPAHVLWRFDPIIFSTLTRPSEIREQFAHICSGMAGATERCYFSYVNYYGKVLRNFEHLHQEQGIVFRANEELEGALNKCPGAAAFACDLSRDELVGFSGELAQTAGESGITMYTCCGDYLIQPNIEKAHCVDADLLSELLGIGRLTKHQQLREECGCFESRDLGIYDTCPHGCQYCYANCNKEVAWAKYQELRGKSDVFSLLPNAAREEFPKLPPSQPDLFM